MTNPALAFRPAPGTIPDEPGCYQFKDAHGRVIYVGKASSLRQRLGNYFQAWRNIAARTRAMLEAARSVEWIVVSNEVEALHLEYTLIQRYRPRYNVRYRDDKSYPYLVLTTSEDVPRARVKRGGVSKGDRRYGPYAHAYAIRETLDLLLRIFPVRTCSQGVYDRAERTDRPCLYYHIGKCAAPCVGHVSTDEHRELVDGLGAFLDGDTEPVVRRLEADMESAASELNFEAAARLRDQLMDARKALSKQQMASSKPEDFDVVAVWQDEIEAAVQAFFVRRGRVVGRKGWTVDKVEPLSIAELYTSFLLQLYEEREDDVPPLVLVEELPEDADALSTLLADLRREHHEGAGRPIQRVELRVPARGEKVQILQTVKDTRARPSNATGSSAPATSTPARRPCASCRRRWTSTPPRCGSSATTSATSAAPRWWPPWWCSRTACRASPSTAGSSSRTTATTTSPPCARSSRDASAPTWPNATAVSTPSRASSPTPRAW